MRRIEIRNVDVTFGTTRAHWTITICRYWEKSKKGPKRIKCYKTIRPTN